MRVTAVGGVRARRRHIQNKVVVIEPLVPMKITYLYAPERAVLADEHCAVYGGIVVTYALNVFARKILFGERRSLRFLFVKFIEERGTESKTVFLVDITHLLTSLALLYQFYIGQSTIFDALGTQNARLTP